MMMVLVAVVVVGWWWGLGEGGGYGDGSDCQNVGSGCCDDIEKVKNIQEPK